MNQYYSLMAELAHDVAELEENDGSGKVADFDKKVGDMAIKSVYTSQT